MPWQSTSSFGPSDGATWTMSRVYRLERRVQLSVQALDPVHGSWRNRTVAGEIATERVHVEGAILRGSALLQHGKPIAAIGQKAVDRHTVDRIHQNRVAIEL